MWRFIAMINNDSTRALKALEKIQRIEIDYQYANIAVQRSFAIRSSSNSFQRALPPLTPNRSLEVGDRPRFHDDLFNFIPAVCFEIGSAISMLNNPGMVGGVIGGYAQKLSRVMNKIYNGSGGQQLITFNGNTLSLKEVFDLKILKPLSPESDQIGRCSCEQLGQEWLSGAGFKWLVSKLDSPVIDNSYKDTLTKLRAINGFGSIIWESLIAHKTFQENRIVLESILPIDSRLSEIFHYFGAQLAHDAFNSFEGRARTERPPIIEGRPINKLEGVDLFASGHLYGQSFGRIYHEAGISDLVLKQKYMALEIEKGRQGMPRSGDPIIDKNRPGLLSEHSFEAMPKAFREINLPLLLKEFAFPHGSGTSRWRLHGTQALASWEADKPAAGAYSLGAVVMLLGMGCLERGNITDFIGNSDKILPAGLAISSFMNFGGYHSFVETFPIAQALAQNCKLEVPIAKSKMLSLYGDIKNATTKYCPTETNMQVHNFYAAYKSSIPQASLAQYQYSRDN